MKRIGNRGLRPYLLIWGAISVLVVGGLLLTMQSIHASEKREGKVNLDFKTKIQPPEMPLIDEAAPSIIETATFGLG